MIAILLTTYNSTRFLGELLDSLLCQTHREWQLYVRDDQSTDNTLELVAQYMAKDNRIHLLEDKQKRGAMNGFMWMLEQVQADYYMFCDHDDVWKADKVEVTLNKMLEHKEMNDKPIVVHTDLEVVNGDLQCLHPSYWEFENFCHADFNSKYFHLPYNNITGCTMMLNERAKEVSLPVSPYAQMHDWWVAACVLWNGGVVLNVPQTTMYYRQHGTNTIGALDLPPLIDKFRHVQAVHRRMMEQAYAAKAICGMSVPVFVMIKTYYMCRLYLRHLVRKCK